MVNHKESICPGCSGSLKYYDSVQRIVRTMDRKTRHVRIRRFRCVNCGHVHRLLPNYLLPYKQYEKDIVLAILGGFITCETLGYEDYPCEMTMNRWKTKKEQILMSHNP